MLNEYKRIAKNNVEKIYQYTKIRCAKSSNWQLVKIRDLQKNCVLQYALCFRSEVMFFFKDNFVSFC